MTISLFSKAKMVVVTFAHNFHGARFFVSQSDMATVTSARNFSGILNVIQYGCLIIVSSIQYGHGDVSA